MAVRLGIVGFGILGQTSYGIDVAKSAIRWLGIPLRAREAFWLSGNAKENRGNLAECLDVPLILNIHTGN